MQFTAKELAQLLAGKIEGDPQVKVHQLAGIETATDGCISFVSNEKYLPFAYTTNASILVISEAILLRETIQPTIIRVQDAYLAFAQLQQHYQQNHPQPSGIHPNSCVEASVSLGKSLYLGAFAYIGHDSYISDEVKIYPQVYIGDRVEIGAGTIIYAGAKIYSDTKIGANCIIHAGVVIGSDGFGFAPQADGRFQKIPQLGNVIIEEEVEIGANSTIDCGTMGATIIRRGVKIDNLVQIAHNVEIGAHTVIAAQVGISGSTKLGKHCLVGGQAGFVGHIKIADGTKINAQSGVSKSVKESGKSLTGSPAFAFRDSLRAQAIYRRLPSLEARVKVLEKSCEVRGAKCDEKND